MKTLLLVLWLAASATGCRPPAPPPPGPASERLTLTLTGWFTVVRGDRTRFYLTDDAGKATELLVPDALWGTLGGPRAYDRRRVRVTGAPAAEPAGAVTVTTLDVLPG